MTDETKTSQPTAEPLARRLKLPHNCRVVMPPSGTVFGFIGAEAIRRAKLSPSAGSKDVISEHPGGYPSGESRRRATNPQGDK